MALLPYLTLHTKTHTGTHAQIDRDWQTQCNRRLKRRKDVFCCFLSLSLFDTHTYIFFFLWLFSPSFFHTLITSVYSSSVMCRYYKNRYPIRHKATVTVAYSRHALLCSPWNCDMVLRVITSSGILQSPASESSMYQVHLLTLSDNMHATAVYCQLLWIIIIYLFIFFYEVLCWRALQESELPLSRYSHSVFCLWGFKVLPVWWPNHFSAFEEAAVEGRPIRYAQFVWICCRPHCVTECTSPSLSEVCVREGDKSDESLNHDSNSVNTKK